MQSASRVLDSSAIKQKRLELKPLDILNSVIKTQQKYDQMRTKKDSLIAQAVLQPKQGTGMLFRRKTWSWNSFYKITQIKAGLVL